MTHHLTDKYGLANELGVAFTPRRVIDLYRRRKIPGVKLGYRTVLFDPAAVRAALKKFEVREVSR